MKVCNYCGCEFDPTTSKQVCCSKRCNVAKWRTLNPDKVKISSLKSENSRKGTRKYNSDYRKKWYDLKKKDLQWVNKIRSQEKNRYIKVQEFLNNYKLSHGCKICGYNKHPFALHFHHISDKSINVCNSKSIKQAKLEIEKCIVLCANCHAIVTNCKPDIFWMSYEEA